MGFRIAEVKRVDDPIYFYDSENASYVELTSELFEKIGEGEIKL